MGTIYMLNMSNKMMTGVVMYCIYIDNYKCVSPLLFKKQVFSSSGKLSTDVNEMESCSDNNKYMQISNKRLFSEDFRFDYNYSQNGAIIYTGLSGKTHINLTLSEPNTVCPVSVNFTGSYTIDGITQSTKRINFIDISKLTKSFTGPLLSRDTFITQDESDGQIVFHKDEYMTNGNNICEFDNMQNTLI